MCGRCGSAVPVEEGPVCKRCQKKENDMSTCVQCEERFKGPYYLALGRDETGTNVSSAVFCPKCWAELRDGNVSLNNTNKLLASLKDQVRGIEDQLSREVEGILDTIKLRPTRSDLNAALNGVNDAIALRPTMANLNDAIATLRTDRTEARMDMREMTEKQRKLFDGEVPPPRPIPTETILYERLSSEIRSVAKSLDDERHLAATRDEAAARTTQILRGELMKIENLAKEKHLTTRRDAKEISQAVEVLLKRINEVDRASGAAANTFQSIIRNEHRQTRAVFDGWRGLLLCAGVVAILASAGLVHLLARKHRQCEKNHVPISQTVHNDPNHENLWAWTEHP